jgi:hypothetical protein
VPPWACIWRRQLKARLIIRRRKQKRFALRIQQQ